LRSLIILIAALSCLHCPQVLFAQEKASKPKHIEYPGDKEYANFLAKGQQLEKQAKLSESLSQYNNALRVKRYEMPSYYVLLDIGRIQYKLGQDKAAITTLEDYLQKITVEIKVEKGEMLPPGGLIIPAYTEQGMKELLSDKQEAEALIQASKARLAAKERTNK